MQWVSEWVMGDKVTYWAVCWTAKIATMSLSPFYILAYVQHSFPLLPVPSDSHSPEQKLLNVCYFWKLRGCGFRIWETISKPPLSHCEQEPLLPVDQWHGSASEHSGVQYAKSLSIQYSSNINICQNPLIHINIFLNLIIDSDFFQKSLYRY